MKKKLTLFAVVGMMAFSSCANNDDVDNDTISEVYEVSNVSPADLLGEWISVKETGQLRINYNMTDWMPLGSKIELHIEPLKDDFYKFIGYATVHNYVTKEILQISVHETNVQIKNGFFYHYHFEANELIYKKPIYEFENDTFKTAIYQYDFVFKRKNNNKE